MENFRVKWIFGVVMKVFCVYLLVGLSEFGFGQVIEKCPGVIKEVDVNLTDRSWLVKMHRDFHVEIELKEIYFNEGCASFLIGPGNNPNVQVGIRINKHDKGKKIRVGTNRAFVHVKDVVGASFHLEITCFRYTTPPTNLTVPTTIFTPLDKDVTVESCLSNIDNVTLNEFIYNGSSSLRVQFEKKVTDKCLEIFKPCWNEKDTIETYIAWPIFVSQDEHLPIFQICFRVTVKLISEECTLDSKKLETVISKIGDISIDENFKIYVSNFRKKEGLAYVAAGILVASLSFLGFFLLWYSTQVSSIICFPTKKKKPNLGMEVQMFPAIKENPILRMSEEINQDVDNSDFWFSRKESDDYEKTSSGVGNSFSTENGPKDLNGGNSQSLQHLHDSESLQHFNKNNQNVSDFAPAVAYSGKLMSQVPEIAKQEESGGVHFNPIVEVTIHETLNNETYL